MKIEYDADKHTKKDCDHCGYWPPVVKMEFSEEGKNAYLCYYGMIEFLDQIPNEDIELKTSLKKGYHYL